jgi:hypothetical protein
VKKSEVKVGSYYLAKVNGRTVPVRLDSIEQATRRIGNNYSGESVYGEKSLYCVTNLASGRETTFRSAAKFQAEITQAEVEKRLRTDTLGRLIAAAAPVEPQEEEADAGQQAPLLAGDTVYLSGSPDPWTIHSFFGAFANLADSAGRIRPAVAIDSISLTHPEFGDPSRLSQEEVADLFSARADASRQEWHEQQAERQAAGEDTSGDYGRKKVRDATAPTAAAAPSLAQQLRQKAAASQEQQRRAGLPPHVIVRARAGTGKTTTAVEGLKVMMGLPVRITPSPQQKAVWDALAESKGARSIAVVAFNNAIAEELKGKVPQGVDAMTMHSLGNRAVRDAFGQLKAPNKFRTEDIIEELLHTDIRALRRDRMAFLIAVRDLVSYCKQSLTDPIREGSEALDALVDHFLVEIQEGEREEVYDLVGKVLERSKDVKRDGAIDFNDMIWLPIVLNLRIQKYDLLIVDEAQDLNKARQELAFRAGTRLVMIGDDRQAIYGFTGTDVAGLDTCQERLGATPRGCVLLPLTVTRRCGKAIVEEARKEVADFEAHESNREGKISEAKYPIPRKSSNYWVGKSGSGELPYEETYMPQVREGDMILCRCNAPLVSQCFRFLKRGRKAYIQGRDIGEGIVRMIEGFKASSTADLIIKMEEWLAEETKKENAKKNPNENKIISLQGKFSEFRKTSLAFSLSRSYTTSRRLPQPRPRSKVTCVSKICRRKPAGCSSRTQSTVPGMWPLDRS